MKKEALIEALFIRKVHVSCPVCYNDLDDGMPHRQECPHYATELEVLKIHDKTKYNSGL